MALARPLESRERITSKHRLILTLIISGDAVQLFLDGLRCDKIILWCRSLPVVIEKK